MEYTDIIGDLRKILRAINLESKRIQKEYGVSIPQLLCLNFLYSKHDYKSTSTEIKHFLNLNASTVTGILSRLEKRNLIARLPKGGDKRVNYITITSTGEKLLKDIPPLMHNTLSDKLEKLPGAKVHEIKVAIHTLVDILGISGMDAAPMFTIEEADQKPE